MDKGKNSSAGYFNKRGRLKIVKLCLIELTQIIKNPFFFSHSMKDNRGAFSPVSWENQITFFMYFQSSPDILIWKTKEMEKIKKIDLSYIFYCSFYGSEREICLKHYGKFEFFENIERFEQGNIEPIVKFYKNWKGNRCAIT